MSNSNISGHMLAEFQIVGIIRPDIRVDSNVTLYLTENL
jgi:hypothetical protein